MNKRLYVGGISYDTTDQGLRQAFEKAGAVDTAVIIMDRVADRSKGFGFVEMATEEDAKAAIEMWNGKELDGRTLVVNESRPREERPQSGGNNRGGYAGSYRGNR